MTASETIMTWLLNICRVCVGLAMVYSGAQLLHGDALLSNSQFDSPLTGLFVIALGLYCIFAGIFPKIFSYMQRRQSGNDQPLV